MCDLSEIRGTQFYAMAFLSDLTRVDGAITVFTPILKMEALMQEYENLKRLVTEAEEDVNKAIGGNKAAGTRVRKKMQEIKAAATDIRKKILESRDTEPGVA
jgi:hypothetical protein